MTMVARAPDRVRSVDRPARSDRPCPVCASRDARALHRCRYALFDDSDLPMDTTIVACHGCGVVYADSAADASAYRRHYRRHSKYETAIAASGSGVSNHDAARLDDTVAWIALHMAADASILDVGAGQGGLLRAFRQNGWSTVVGIDPSAGCVAAMKRHGIEAAIGQLEDSTWPTDPRLFDLVVLSHVLEHVFDAADVFVRIASRVVEGGRMYIEVPDASRYALDPFPPFYFFDPEHINHFDGSSLGVLAGRSGWKVEAVWTRDLVLTGARRYPAKGVLLGRASQGSSVASSDRASTEGPVERYVAASRAEANGLPGLRNACATDRPIVLWGAGSHAQRLLAQVHGAGLRIDCIIDSDPGKQGRRLARLPVVAPAEGLARASELKADVVIAIAVGAEDVVERLAIERPDLTVLSL